MKKGKLNDAEARKELGQYTDAAFKKLQNEVLEPTNRLGFQGLKGEETEFSASVQTMDANGNACTLIAYAYGDDAEQLEISGYEII